jgi:hypothetical protein
MTYVNHRDTEDTKTHRGLSLGGNAANENQSQKVSVRLSVLRVSVVGVRDHGRRERQPSTATAITMIAPMMIS